MIRAGFAVTGLVVLSGCACFSEPPPEGRPDPGPGGEEHQAAAVELMMMVEPDLDLEGLARMWQGRGVRFTVLGPRADGLVRVHLATGSDVEEILAELDQVEGVIAVERTVERYPINSPPS